MPRGLGEINPAIKISLPGRSAYDISGKKTHWAWAVGTFFGVGYLKPGPGTYASVATVLLWWCAAHGFGIGPHDFSALTFLAMVVVTAVGIPASTIVAREAVKEDPGFVVIDEVAGQLFALISLSPTWVHGLLALVLFRLFDIWKPWPIRKVENLRAGGASCWMMCWRGSVRMLFCSC